MMELQELLKNKKVNEPRLLAFGFKDRGGFYAYNCSVAGGRMELAVRIFKNGAAETEMTDARTRSRYVLHLVDGAEGAFVGQVRQEYERLLSRVALECFDRDVFKSAQAGKLIAYAREKYGGELEFLWEKFSDNAVLRRRDTGKWYAALLTVPKRKLGLAADGRVEILDLRADPAELPGLLAAKHYFPGYHMNKKHWFTVCLDGTVPLQEILFRLDESYRLADKK